MIAIPNMDKPKDCWECFNADCNHWGEHGYDNSTDCPLIEIDLVRCGECIHKIQALSTEKGATGCELIRGTFYEDFFCKEGERRADETNSRFLDDM